jgi:poly(A) polymerase
MASLVENIPPSRLFDETLKLLTSGYAVKCVEQLRAEGLHHGLLPLLDVILGQEIGERFVMLALTNTDQRVLAGKPISPGFLFATLLWHEVLSKWETILAGGKGPVPARVPARIPALFQAMDEVLEVQGEKLAITRRIAGDIKDIWALQPRFEQRSGKRPYGVLEQPRFKAAYDFLLLRAESGEVDKELALWWTDFMNHDGDARAAMLLPAKADEAKKRKRRKRKPAAEPTE